MKVLESYKLAMMSLGGCPVDESASWLKRIALHSCAIIVFIYQVCCALSTIVFIKRIVSVSLEDTLFALFQVAGLIYVIYALIMSYVMRHKIDQIFSKLAEIYRKYKTTRAFKHLDEANNQCEWICHFYLKYATMIGFVCTSIGMIVTSMGYSMIVYGYIDVLKIYHMYKVVLPWNQETYLGYLWDMIFCFIEGMLYMFIAGAFLFLFVSICLHHSAFLRMFQQFVDDDEQRNAEIFLRDLVQFHVLIKDWFLHTAETYSFLILVRLICSVVFMACSAFQVDLQLKHLNFNIVLVIMVVSLSVTDLFLYCFFGKVATDSHTSLADCLFESNWIELPIKHQKVLILMISNMQKPLYYHGFGIANLNLETFKKYIKTVYTFYMMFKTISE